MKNMYVKDIEEYRKNTGLMLRLFAMVFTLLGASMVYILFVM